MAKTSVKAELFYLKIVFAVATRITAGELEADGIGDKDKG
jgi:hypothetical protein